MTEQIAEDMPVDITDEILEAAGRLDDAGKNIAPTSLQGPAPPFCQG